MRRLACALAATLALAGCGGDETAGDVLSDAAGKLGELRSGQLKLDVRGEGRGAGADAVLGFGLEGPFELAEKGRLPKAELVYTQVAGDEQADVTFISTGAKAWIRSGEGLEELQGAQLAAVRSAAGDISSDGGFEGLDLERWLDGEKLTERGELTEIRGQLDVAEALADIGRLTGIGAFGEDERERIAGAVAEAPVTVVVDGERLLRRIDARIKLDLEVPEKLRRQLGELAGGTLSFEMTIERPNEPVSVAAPK